MTNLKNATPGLMNNPSRTKDRSDSVDSEPMAETYVSLLALELPSTFSGQSPCSLSWHLFSVILQDGRGKPLPQIEMVLRSASGWEELFFPYLKRSRHASMTACKETVGVV